VGESIDMELWSGFEYCGGLLGKRSAVGRHNTAVGDPSKKSS